MAARILVVDDEPNARMALVSILREEGYLVDEARDGRAAVEALAVRGADLVLTDLRMPRMGGLELIETV
ncbi:MAG TPA: response regulator, partial [Acidimicrobiales bacterium]|nr:response regulator [Acidimicrobiales bacterium]